MAKRRTKKQEPDILEPEVLGPAEEMPGDAPATELAPSADTKPNTTAVVPVTALQQYLAEIRRHPYLSKEEELRLFDGALRRRQLRLILGGKMAPNDAIELKALFSDER